ncbi:methyl-accepting chemotaxis protein [Alkalicoccus urumqiensis]|nr:methyl-accepting chemotaxis protein [Alkalicoccus urumqiensis]
MKQRMQRLLPRLYLLTAVIILTCLTAGGLLYYFTNEVQNSHETSEQVTAFNQEYHTLIQSIHQMSLEQMQLTSGGYDESLVESLESSVVEARDLLTSLEESSLDEDLLHYLAFLHEPVDQYESHINQYFSSVFIGEEAEQIENRIMPGITRAEAQTNSVHERVESMLQEEQQAASSSLESALSFTEQAVTGALLILIIVPLAGFLWFGYSLRTGLKKLRSRIQAYSRNDYLFLQEPGSDELGEADRELALMGQKLASYEEKNETLAEEVMQAVHSVNRLADKQQAALTEMEGDTSGMDSRVHLQSDHTTSISASTEELAAGTEEIDGQLTEMLEEMKSIRRETDDGRSDIYLLQQTMADLDDRLGGSTEAAESLSTMMSEVETFLAGIGDITEKTKMLAINASIEAAKAGEAGRSFAVVAGEIQRLSEGTKSFSSQMHTVLRSMQQKAEGMVTSFSEFKQSALEMGEQTEQTASRFNLVKKKTEAAETEQRQVAASIHEMTGTIAEAAESVAELASSATELLENSGNIHTSIQKQLQDQQILNKEMKSLERTAERLRSSKNEEPWNLKTQHEDEGSKKNIDKKVAI